MDSTARPPNGKPGAFSVWCPETLDLDGLHESEGARVAEGVLCLGHCVLVGLAADARCRDSGKVPLRAEYLRAVIGRHHLEAVRDAAERLGYVGRERSYRAGSRSQRYEILEPYALAQPVKRALTDIGLCRNIRKWRESRQREAWQRIRRGDAPVAPVVCAHLWQQLHRIRIDDDIEFGEDFHSAHLIAVDAIRTREFWFKVDDYGRIHTNITNLARLLRAHLTVDGRRLVNVDIGESQPLFIGLALAAAKTREERKRRGRGGDNHGRTPSLMMDTTMMDKATSTGLGFERGRLPGDLGEYVGLCEAGGLYQAVAERLGMTRDEAKPKVMQALYGKPRHRTAAVAVLQARFPSVMGAMREIKRGDHRRLAHFAQRIESQFMFGRVVPRIVRERPGLFVATIHDSILTTTGDEGYIRRVMLAEFGRLGVCPKVKVERCEQTATPGKRAPDVPQDATEAGSPT